MKPLLIGEANPYGGDAYYALYPQPMGCTGDRLCRVILGLKQDVYLERFDRMNLCHRQWSLRDAREAAGKVLPRDGVVVLLGAKVARACGFPFDPFAVIGQTVVLPHPSGLCRIWSQPNAVERARAALRSVGALQ